MASITGEVNPPRPFGTSKVSVITPSLNHGRFLRDTTESIVNQSYKNVEHVIVDGGSTDNTLQILREYPHIKWISEKEEGDNPVLDAFWKAFYMSQGDYIVILALSDGILDRTWFEQCVKILDRDHEVSHVWGLSQNMSEDGQLGKLWRPEFLENHPPQKKDFLPFWLATRHGVESNAVFRRAIFETCNPRNNPDEPYRFHPTLGLNYNLNVRGYLPYFLPVISYFGRTHESQRQQKHHDLLEAISRRYDQAVRLYRRSLLAGKVRHYFRDGSSRIVGEVSSSELNGYRRKILRYRLKQKLQRNFVKLLEHI